MLVTACDLSIPTTSATDLEVRTTYLPGGETTWITDIVFDAISVGTLLLIGLVEPMAHELMFFAPCRRHLLKCC